MKIKAVWILLLTLLLCIRANLYVCACAPQVSHQTTGATLCQKDDLCQDCGHTKSCCHLQHEVKLFGSTVFAAADFQTIDEPQQTLFDYNAQKLSASLKMSGCNKAPPRLRNHSLITLQQKLLV